MRRCSPCCFSLLRTTNASSAPCDACSIAAADRVGAEGQPADRVVGPVGGELAHHPSDERGRGAVQRDPAQVDVVVGLPAGGQGHPAVDDGEVPDQLQQFVAVGQSSQGRPARLARLGAVAGQLGAARDRLGVGRGALLRPLLRGRPRPASPRSSRASSTPAPSRRAPPSHRPARRRIDPRRAAPSRPRRLVARGARTGRARAGAFGGRFARELLGAEFEVHEDDGHEQRRGGDERRDLERRRHRAAHAKM